MFLVLMVFLFVLGEGDSRFGVSLPEPACQPKPKKPFDSTNASSFFIMLNVKPLRMLSR